MKPKTNALVALNNLLAHNSSILTPIFRSNGQANTAGDSLEYFVKDIFCGSSFQYQYEDSKNKEYNKYLSWTGNSTNFPDFIVRDGIGVEPKKLDNESHSSLSLNSSYPKDYIYPDSQNIPSELLVDETERWDRKAILYVVGNKATRFNKLGMVENKLISLWMAFGNTFVADRSVYLDTIDAIRSSIKKSGATLENSKEIARAKQIDPLGYTNLRVRGMYELRHPEVVFKNYKKNINPETDSLGTNITRVYLVMLKTDYDLITDKPDFSEYINNGHLYINDIEIADPNGSGQSLEAKFFEAYTD